MGAAAWVRRVWAAQALIDALEAQLAASARVNGLLDSLTANPPQHEQVLSSLALVHEGTPLWRALIQLLRQQQEAEVAAALSPNLSNEASHYNRGRAAAVADVLDALLKLWGEAQDDSRKRQ